MAVLDGFALQAVGWKNMVLELSAEETFRLGPVGMPQIVAHLLRAFKLAGQS